MSTHPAFTPKLGETNIRMLIAQLEYQQRTPPADKSEDYQRGYADGTAHALRAVRQMWEACLLLSQIDRAEYQGGGDGHAMG